MKFRPVRAELFHADGWTDMTKLRAPFAILQKRLKVTLCSSIAAIPFTF